MIPIGGADGVLDTAYGDPTFVFAPASTLVFRN